MLRRCAIDRVTCLNFGDNKTPVPGLHKLTWGWQLLEKGNDFGHVGSFLNDAAGLPRNSTVTGTTRQFRIAVSGLLLQSALDTNLPR